MSALPSPVSCCLDNAAQTCYEVTVLREENFRTYDRVYHREPFSTRKSWPPLDGPTLKSHCYVRWCQKFYLACSSFITYRYGILNESSPFFARRLTAAATQASLPHLPRPHPAQECSKMIAHDPLLPWTKLYECLKIGDDGLCSPLISVSYYIKKKQNPQNITSAPHHTTTYIHTCKFFLHCTQFRLCCRK